MAGADWKLRRICHLPFCAPLIDMLDSFPPEVLQIVFMGLEAKQLAWLWFTGSRILHWKMSRAVNRLKFGSGRSRVQNFEYWPTAFLASFPNLTRLIVNLVTSSIHPAPLTLTKLQVLSLPTNLLYLHVRISNFLTAETMPLLPRTLTSLRLDNEEGLPNESLRDLPPSLTVFGIWLPTMTDDCMDYLPRSITHLCLWSSAKFVAANCALKLPPGIVRLRVGVQTDSVWLHYYTDLESKGLLSQAQIEANENKKFASW